MTIITFPDDDRSQRGACLSQVIMEFQENMQKEQFSPTFGESTETAK